MIQVACIPPCQCCSSGLAQTHEGLPVVDATGQPTKRVHAFGPKWQALYAPEYESITFRNPTLKCALRTARSCIACRACRPSHGCRFDACMHWMTTVTAFVQGRQ